MLGWEFRKRLMWELKTEGGLRLLAGGRVH
jgi:hypothetical protein